MTDEQIKNIIDTNFRILILLGYSTSLVMEYKNFLVKESKEHKKCEWFIQALNDVIYLQKPLPPFLD